MLATKAVEEDDATRESVVYAMSGLQYVCFFCRFVPMLTYMCMQTAHCFQWCASGQSFCSGCSSGVLSLSEISVTSDMVFCYFNFEQQAFTNRWNWFFNANNLLSLAIVLNPKTNHAKVKTMPSLK
jgi:hypothetical protein